MCADLDAARGVGREFSHPALLMSTPSACALILRSFAGPSCSKMPVCILLPKFWEDRCN